MNTNIKDFYETPAWLITKMIGCLKKKRYNNISGLSFLEPSAGKGAIAEQIVYEYRNDGCKSDVKQYLDVIEIDPELQHVLKGKDLKLVHDNFMTFETFKAYDVIIANFPFSVGDKHLMKAIRMQERTGGQIVCLVNAETIRNPYTNLRKELQQLLNKYEAVIEFIPGAFEDGDRPTEVEVALIHITIPTVICVDHSVILEKMEEAKAYEDTEEEMNSVISGDEFKGICQTFWYAAETGVRFIEEYYRLNAVIFSADIEKKSYEKPLISLNISDNKYASSNDKTKSELINEFLEETRLKYWKLIFNTKSIQSLITSDVSVSLQSMIEEMRQYDVTLFNAYQIRRRLIETLNVNIEIAIEKLFDELTRYAYDDKNILYFNGWKTNKGWKLGKKAIIRLSAYDSIFKTMRIDYHIKERITEMQKVLNYLCTGRQKIDNASIYNRLDQYEKENQMKNLEFDYFKLTFYKAGSCHIEFKDERLIERFNIYIGKRRNWLPPTYGKKEYYNMTPEEKEVINAFQDEFSYERCRRDEDVQRVIRDNQFLLEMEA